MNKKMPELDRLTVGDELTVSARNGRQNREVRVQVTKVGRVWIDVEPLDGAFLPHYFLRYRLDTQLNESKSARFYTDEQWAWSQRKSRAVEYLAEIGVQADFGSRFHNDPLTLANAIRRGLGEDEL
jgi:hypothetical protein